MKYLKSTTQKTYVFNGKHVPACITKDNDVLSMSDSDYADFIKSKVVASLINNGAIIVLDKAPTTPTQQAKTLTNQVASLTLENTRLQEELKELKASSNASEEVEALKAALKKQEDDDRAEIQQLAAEKDEEIAKLKAQLEEATSSSKKSKKTSEE